MDILQLLQVIRIPRILLLPRSRFLAGDCTLITFYSEPKEAFLTSVFRILDVFRCSYVGVFASRSREAEAKDFVEFLKKIIRGTEFGVYGLFPDPSDLSLFDGLAERILNILRSLRERGRLVIAVFTGSRLEVSTIVLAAQRIREDVVLVYTPFYWGPWNKLFYPFTPRPLEPLTILHPSSEDVKDMVKPAPEYPIGRSDAESLFEKVGILSKLRKEIAYTQHKINLEFATSTLLHPVDIACKRMSVSITLRGVHKVSAEARDYCNHGEVVDMIDKLGRDSIDVFSEHNEEDRAVNLLLKFSSVLLPVVEECTFGCADYRNTILTDFVSLRGEKALVDTNIIYSSLHTLLYEKRGNIAIPLCAYVELLRHRAHFEKPYEKLRSAIAGLAIEEIKSMRLEIDEKASQQPCEVGIALAGRVAITCDRKAYEEIFKTMNIGAILVQLKPLKEVRFLEKENSRRVAYAYHALAQLRALTSMEKIRKILSEMNIAISYG